MPSELKSEDLEVIAAMNDVYFTGGRPGNVGKWSGTQVRFAANYFLRLLDGLYIELSSQLERRIKAESPQEVVIRQAVDAFSDFTKRGLDFLYHADPNISEDVMKEIALKLIGKIERTTYTDRESASRAISALTGHSRSEEVLPSAKNTWLEDHRRPPLVPYDADITNRALIPEAIQYARRNIPFIR